MLELFVIATSVVGMVVAIVLALHLVEKRTGKKWPPLANKPRLEFDESRVLLTRSNGKVEEVAWDDLQAVIIETTDQGPGVCDVFIILVGKSSGCVIPQDLEKTSELLTRLQLLPDFDNRRLIDSMGSSENERFLCWERKF